MSKCDGCFYHCNGRYGWRCGFDGRGFPNKVECNNYAKLCQTCGGKCKLAHPEYIDSSFWFCPKCDGCSGEIPSTF